MSAEPQDVYIDDEPLVQGDNTFASVTEKVVGVLEAKHPPKIWYLLIPAMMTLAGLMTVFIGWLFYEGTGVWGLNNPANWGWAIVNFVFWVGIGHAGTLISAILFLFRQQWRTAINRFAEAMTIFAVICAGTFPGIHIGRPWLPYWMLPLPNQMGMWPNFASPLLWDVFAVSTYFTVSCLFWYVGLIPDLATVRDRAKHWVRKYAYGFLSLGWRGGNRQWQHYEKAYLILAGISTPLVLSVHSVVSFDFAVSIVPGWHTTIFPPYFVAGAIFSGFAMVVTLAIPARHMYGIQDIITKRHLENMAKIMLLTGMLVGYAYGCEFFIAWYSGVLYEQAIFIKRAAGPYYWAYWTMVFCNVVVPQVFWFKACRRNEVVLFVCSILINIGMWFERFVITITSLSNDYMPSSWDYYSPSIIDVGTFIGSFGAFMFLFLLFLRFLPMVAISEVKNVLPAADPHAGHDH